MQSTNFTDYKSPEQIAEATRQAVRDTADGADAYTAGVAHAAGPSKQGRAGQLLDELRSRGRQWREQGGHYVSDRPVRSMVMAAAGGAAVTTLMLAALRGSRR
ncbi:hypothetical protein QTI33_04120 [Variovorax sp. J22P271]|uniref:hypothetical protein n=1 Tax=Variovorax davisae TaxID=3053515 RepID=UPI0025791559|nr:hypothetical protein [Variovorax sp. J22P271]MDM0031322.1 hypothetical protein [Variovorax sp. J22P271]